MRLRLLPLIVLTLLLAAVRPAAAQPAAPLPATAVRLLTRYTLLRSELPPRVRLDRAPEEQTNEDVVAADPDAAAYVQKYGRLLGVEQVAQRASGAGNIAIDVTLFRDAEGAWGDAQDTTFSVAAEVERTIPGPPVGDNSALYHLTLEGERGRLEAYGLYFQRDRVEVGVVVLGLAGSPSLAEILPVAQAVDAKIVADPPPPPTPEELALLEAPTPTVLVRGAVRLMTENYVNELNTAQLLTEAWEGAARALAAAGVEDVPPAPAYAQDEAAAIAQHMQAFPQLETLAEGRLTERQLAYAAIGEIVSRRDDCHTYHLSPERWETYKAQQSGGSFVAIGISLSLAAPLKIVSVLPNSPARAAGLRRGQMILAINGQSADGLNSSDARALIDPREGALNVFTVQNPSGRTQDIRVAPARFTLPSLETEMLPGNIGLIRFSTFQAGDEQVRLLRQALTEFEAQGVRGWIIDLRGNSGGSAMTTNAMLNLFVSSGRLYGTIGRGGNPVFIEAQGTPLPFQRPLVFLVDEGSASASEVLSGTLQARGRAAVVGEKTAGCVGSTRPNGLMDGSALFVTRTELVLGPDGIRAHRVGITPNVEAQTTAADEEAGRDPQRDAAVAALQQVIAQPDTPVPAPRQPTTSAVVAGF